MIKREHITRYLLLLVMGVLLLPLFQESTSIFSERPLKGFFTPAKSPIVKLENWWDGTFQDSFELAHNEQFGLRNTFVRLHNQCEYEIFKRASTSGVIVGKDDYLYEISYIKAYNGEDFIGEPTINEMTRKLKILQDTLAKRNITLIVAIAPGKASYFPEYIPDALLSKGKNTNYNSFNKSLIAASVNYINFSQWFINQKKSSLVPLYPKTGIHWSNYAANLAADSLIGYIESKRGIDMPSLKRDGFYWSDSLIIPDDDLGLAMNLLFPIHPLKMAYPWYDFEKPENKTKVRMMLISDSFGWHLFGLGLVPHAMSTIDFWYYNQQIYHAGEKPLGEEQDMNACLETERNQVVLILSTEPNLSKLGWGYIDEAYNYFVLKQISQEEKKMLRADFLTKIKTDKTLLSVLKLKADSAKITLDSMIQLHAAYMTDQKTRK